MKNKTFKINTKKRNIIIASVIGVIAITAGTFFGVYSYSKSNEIEDPAVEETVATVSDSSIEDTTEVGEVEDTETVSANSTDKPEEVVEEPTTTKPTKPTSEPTTEKPAKPEPTTEAPTPTPTHTHSYTSKVTTQPTCCKEGVRTYTCSCGDTYTEAIATVAHTWFTTHFDGRPIKEYHHLADDGFDFTAAGYNAQQIIDYCNEHRCGSATQPVIVGYTEGYDKTKCSVCGKIK